MIRLEDWITRNIIRGRHFKIASWTTQGKSYRVTYRRGKSLHLPHTGMTINYGGSWTCTCPDYHYQSQPHREGATYECKHVWEIRAKHRGLR